MYLSPGQRQAYTEEGFVLLEEVFSAAECRALRSVASTLMTAARDERILELDGAAVRSVYNVHKNSATFGRLTADPRLLSLAHDVLGEDVYVHQTQLNPKAAFVGEIWEWHQDFYYWHHDDGMAAPTATNVVVYLDAMTIFNGPLFLIPRSHLRDYESLTATVGAGWESTLTKELKHVLSHSAVTAAVEEGGLVAPLASAGSVLLFDPRLLHASPGNISPDVRTALFVRYNRMDNTLAPVRNPRPAWVAERDPRRLEPLPGRFLEGEGRRAQTATMEQNQCMPVETPAKATTSPGCSSPLSR